MEIDYEALANLAGADGHCLSYYWTSVPQTCIESWLWRAFSCQAINEPYIYYGRETIL